MTETQEGGEDTGKDEHRDTENTEGHGEKNLWKKKEQKQ